MKPKLLLLLVNLALLAAWLGKLPPCPGPTATSTRRRPGWRTLDGARAVHLQDDVLTGARRLGRAWTRVTRLARYAPAIALLAAACLLPTGCGGSGGDAETAGAPGGGKTLEELWRAPGDDVAVIAGTQNHEPGTFASRSSSWTARGGSRCSRQHGSGSPGHSRPRRFSSRRRSSSASASPAARRRMRRTSTSRTSGSPSPARTGCSPSRRAGSRCRRSGTSSCRRTTVSRARRSCDRRPRHRRSPPPVATSRS